MNANKHDQRIRQKTLDLSALDKWLKAFVVDRKSQDLSHGTLRFYHDKIKLILKFADSRGICSIDDLTPNLIREFLIELSESGHTSGGVHAVYRVLHTFLSWYEIEANPKNWINPIRNIKAPKLLILPLDPVEIKIVDKLLKVCDTSTYYGARDAAILLFLLDTGVRAFELCALDIEDVDCIGGDVLIRSGKGGKPRMVVMGKHTRKAIRTYLRFRKDEETAVWVDIQGNRLTYWGLNLILRRRSKDAGVPKPGLHDFRRAFALNCLRGGMDIYSLQKLMGHADLQVMYRYLAQTDDDLRLAHAKASPVDNAKL